MLVCIQMRSVMRNSLFGVLLALPVSGLAREGAVASNDPPPKAAADASAPAKPKQAAAPTPAGQPGKGQPAQGQPAQDPKKVAQAEPAPQPPAPQPPAPQPTAPPQPPPPSPSEVAPLEALMNVPVSTASGGQAEARSLTSANVVSISRREIAAHGWRTLAEILQHTPGFYVVDDFVLPSVNVRGVSGEVFSGSRLVKVMINGVPVNYRPLLSAFLGPEFIPVEAVERVEIAKGPLSSLYGANAFLAVVNVITRRPNASSGEVAGHVYSGSHQQGEGASGQISFVTGHLDFMAAVSADEINRSGVRISKTFAGQNPQLPDFFGVFDEPSRNDVTHPFTAYGQLGLFSELAGTLRVQGGLEQLDSAAEFQPGSVLTHDSRWYLTNAWTNVSHTQDWSGVLQTALSFGYSQGDPRQREEQLFPTRNTSLAYKRNFGYQAYDASVRLRLTPFERLSLSGGADYSRETEKVLYYTAVVNTGMVGTQNAGDRTDFIGPADPRQVDLSNTGVFGQIAVWLDRFHLTGDVRADIPGDVQAAGERPQSLFPTQYSGRGAIALELSRRLTFKVLGGQAFQTPSAVLLFARPGFGATNNVIGPVNFSSGQTSLRPQQVQSGEFVLSARPLERLAFEGSLYIQSIKDRIAFQLLANNFVAQNLPQSLVGGGGELSVLLALRYLVPYFKMGIHSNQDQNGMPVLVAYPKAVIITGLDARTPDLPFLANLELRYVSERGASQSNILLNNNNPYYLDSYADVDFTLSTLGIDLPGEGAQAKFTLSVRNLADERHSEPGLSGFDYPTLGRTVFFDLRLSR